MDHRKNPWFRFLVLLLLGAGVIGILTTIGDIIEVLVISILLAYLLDPFARWLEAHNLSRTLATVIIFTVLTLVLGGFLFYLFPLLGAQVIAIRDGLDVENVRVLIEEFERQILSSLSFLGIQELNLLDRIQGFITRHLGSVVGVVPGFFSILGNMVAIPFIVFFLLKDGRDMKKGFISLIPNRYFELTMNVIYKTDTQLGNYLRGQVIDAIVVGLLSIFALWMLRVDYYVIIGALGGLANLVPWVGPVVGGGLAVMVSMFTGGGVDKAIAIVLAFIGIQIFDNTIIAPLVIARNVRLHPLLVLLVVFIGGKFFGVIGLFLAVPAAAVGKVLLEEVLKNLKRYRLA